MLLEHQAPPPHSTPRCTIIYKVMEFLGNAEFVEVNVCINNFKCSYAWFRFGNNEVYTHLNETCGNTAVECYLFAQLQQSILLHRPSRPGCWRCFLMGYIWRSSDMGTLEGHRTKLWYKSKLWRNVQRQIS